MNRMIKLTIAYDGTDYCGWQKQNEQRTIEGELIKACENLIDGFFSIKGSSRTDAGVHALGQVASLETSSGIELRKISTGLNHYLPKDIVVQKAEEINPDFHPRFDAIDKTYVYQIYNARVPLPQYQRFSYYFYKPLDIEKMKEAAQFFLGEHDFFAFSSAGGSVKTSIRTITRCDIAQDGNLIKMTVTGKSFLYNMVRIMMGTLIQVGLGKMQPEAIKDILASKNRLKAGPNAPANGLTLIEIKY